MKRIALIGSDTATLARIKIILESRADVELVEGDQVSDFRVALVDGRVLVGDKDYSPEEFDAWRKEAEEHSAKSVRRMSSTCEARVPEPVETMLQRWGENHATLREAGIAYASQQVADLVAHGVDGVHLYTMNHPAVARRIWNNVSGLFTD